MEPIGPRRRSISRGRKLPVEEVETPFPLSGEPPAKKRSIKGKLFLVGVVIPLLVACAFLGILYLQGGKLIYARVYPPLLFKQVVDGKSMDRVMEFLGPPSRLGPEGNLQEWIYEPGSFDFSLYPFLPWNTPIMNGKIVRDASSGKSPRRILVRFDYGNEILPEKGGAFPGLHGKAPELVADVRIEF
jgi:hypothetical protein